MHPARCLLPLAVAALLAAPASAGEVTPEQWLGLALYRDESLSKNRNQSCESCHSLRPERLPDGSLQPSPGFVDPDNTANGTPVSDGSFPNRFGSLNAPMAGYAAFSPFFHFDTTEGLFVGGQFWNGRAATLAEQAKGPFLNPVEMAMSSKWAVVTRLKRNPYYRIAFKQIYDIDLGRIPSRENAPAHVTPPPGVLEAYDRIAQAIAEFEKTRLLNRFTSKFDAWLAGEATLDADELAGMELFNGKAQCNLCHVSDPGIAPNGGLLPPLFTDFTYDNLGIGRNVEIPGNPEPNPGLAGNPTVAALGDDVAAGELGKHKVMTLRNIAITPPYAHNGIFADLEQIVRFYNRRDWALSETNGMYTCADSTDPNFGSTCFPAPEFADTMNTDELGDLGLSDDEERQLIVFMRTLTDGYTHASPFASTPLPPSP